MTRILTAVVIVILLAGNIYFYLEAGKKGGEPKIMSATLPGNPNVVTTTPSFKYIVPAFALTSEMKRVQSTRLILKEYAAINKCNGQYAFIIDMRIPSYKKRFFVYDIKKDSLLSSGLVAHGTGSETFRGELVFSNVPDSRCTSLGKYKIGASYKGIFGLAYKLQGLDSTNNNAMKRAVVLHSSTCVPESEIDEYPICFSYGCPMVSPVFLQQLKVYHF